MNTSLAALATLVCTLGLTAAPAPPAEADSVTVGESGWSVSLAFPDTQWASGSCQHVPVTAVVTGAEVRTWTFGGFVTNTDDEEGEGAYAAYIDYDTKVTDGAGTFTFRHAVALCPGWDYSGRYEVVGEVGVLLTGATEWSWVPYRSTFIVSGAPTTITLDPIVLAGPEATFSGRVVASPASPGTFGGCRYARVEIAVRDGSEWEQVGGADVAEDGSYVAAVPTYNLRGTEYRAHFTGGQLCAPSASEARELPVRLPKVTLSTNARQSKLAVDIDPDKGRRAWAFQVQRRTDDDAWRTLRTYRTRGARETRTINLPKGSYRVRVLARFGYAQTWSDSVFLER